MVPLKIDVTASIKKTPLACNIPSADIQTASK